MKKKEYKYLINIKIKEGGYIVYDYNKNPARTETIGETINHVKEILDNEPESN